ncbi:MAG: hypothetical protein WAZ18_04375 [Alphaproteobacteria bacterium]
MTRLNLAALNATDAHVEVSFTTGNGEIVKGSIENSFFDEFVAQPNQKLSAAKRQRILNDNVPFLIAEADRQLRLGHKHITIA